MIGRLYLLVPLLLIGALSAAAGGAFAAWEPAGPAFERTWNRSDGPIADGAVQRTWTWGPYAVSGTLSEEYVQASGGFRQVQYYDKSRMEITYPDGDPASAWYVTNGLLVIELATGRMQTGDDSFEQRAPAAIPVAGDAEGAGPTYALLGQLRDEPAAALGALVTQRLAADGALSTDASLAGLDVTADYYAPETGHTVAEPFWYFLTSEQQVYAAGELVSEQMFPYPFYATGLPITEAYWVRATLAGAETDVLVQAFERRVLTYTPANPPGWQVEAGNVGRHYYEWRYGVAPEENLTVTTIPTGPDTLEYFARGNPRPDEQDWGPTAISIAPDGSYWMPDSVGARAVQFDRVGRKIGEISLIDQGGRSLWDLDASTGTIWISWSNHVYGLYKLQAYTPDGALLHDIDIPDSLWQDASYEGHAITVNDAGQVIMELNLGYRYVQIVNSAGELDLQPLDAIPHNGHTYRLQSDDNDWTLKHVVVDGHAIPIRANDGAFLVDVHFSLASDDTFYLTRYSVHLDGSFDWEVEHRTLDGRLLGTASVPEDERYIWIAYDYAVGPDGNLYKLMGYREHLEILRVGFAAP